MKREKQYYKLYDNDGFIIFNKCTPEEVALLYGLIPGSPEDINKQLKNLGLYIK